MRIDLGESAMDWSTTCNVCRANERCDGCDTGAQRFAAPRHHLPDLLGRVAQGSPRVIVSLGQMRLLACHVQNGVRFPASLG